MSSSVFDLTGRKILVTGASSGIGHRTCLLINELGGTFIGVARRGAELKELVDQTGNPQNQIFEADLTDETRLAALLEFLPQLDGIVHSAGVADRIPAKFYKKKMIDQIQNINYSSIVLLIAELIKFKKINQGASIVLVSSISALVGSKGNGLYAASKGALNAISRVLAIELASSKVRVNSVAPGMVKTEINLRAIETLTAEAIAEDEKKYPLGYGEPLDVAAPIAFLLSNASRWITGETLVIDGGRTSYV